MEYLRIRNFAKFQHYRDRNPPWIKLYTALLDDIDFMSVPDDLKWPVIGLFLLASKLENKIPANEDYLRNRLSIKRLDIQRLTATSFVELQTDSDSLAPCKRETEERQRRGETETEENPPVSPPEGDVQAPVPTPELLMEIYNSNRGGRMPECRDLTSERRRKCKQRIESHTREPAQFVADFESAVRGCAKNAFLRGDVKAWRSSFDWLLKNDTNYQRVLEGTYDGKNKSKAEQRSERLNEAAQGALNHYMAPDLRGNDEDAGGRGIDGIQDPQLHRVAVHAKPG